MTKERMIEIYERNADSVYGICYSYMKNKADSEDMMQETFMKAFDSGVEFKNEKHERGWLILTASNLCKNNLKHWWRKNYTLEEYDEPALENEYEIDETLSELMKISNKYKTVLFLYYYEEYSSAEISEILKKKESTIRSILRRGRDILKKRLAGEISE